MKIKTGQIRIENDDIVAIISEGKIPINNISLGGREYTIGEEIKGVVIENKFNIVKEYDSETISAFGFISQDDLDNDYIHIRMIQSGDNDEFEVGDEIPVKRDSVKNY